MSYIIKRAAEKGIAQVIFSRIFMATPGMCKPHLKIYTVTILSAPLFNTGTCCIYYSDPTGDYECIGQERCLQENALVECTITNIFSWLLV